MIRSRDVDRIDQTQDGLDDLRGHITTWFGLRRAHDTLRQYWTQLGALERVLLPSVAKVQHEVNGIRRLRQTGEIHAGCGRNDRRIHLLDRYWRYFRDKWDQRDDGEVGPTLLAADEVMWSCWAPPFGAAGDAVDTAPLPYLEPFYTPRTIPRTQPPADVQRADALLRSALDPLPVPLIGLPPVVHSRPWLLGALAHETGHHLQRDLCGGAFYRGLGHKLEAAAVTAGADPTGWSGWHEEIFADACSVLLLGPAAGTVAAEMLRGSDASMLAEDGTYPSSVVRQQLMHEVLCYAGSPASARVPAYQPEGLDDLAVEDTDELMRIRVKTRISAAKPVVGELLSQSPGDHGSLPALCGWDASRYAPDGEVQYWRDELLRTDAEPLPETLPHTARTALAGGVAAWQKMTSGDNAAWRAGGRENLADRIRELLPQCRPPGRRAGREPPEIDVAEASEALAGVLFGAALDREP
jgi:hypothetical protein